MCRTNIKFPTLHLGMPPSHCAGHALLLEIFRKTRGKKTFGSKKNIWVWERHICVAEKNIGSLEKTFFFLAHQSFARELSFVTIYSCFFFPRCVLVSSFLLRLGVIASLRLANRFRWVPRNKQRTGNARRTRNAQRANAPDSHQILGKCGRK